jgi:hypothetical protein
MLTKRQKVKGSEGAFTNPGRIQYKGEQHHLNSNLGYLLASKASAKVLGRRLGCLVSMSKLIASKFSSIQYKVVS